jgi:MioC protein
MYYSACHPKHMYYNAIAVRMVNKEIWGRKVGLNIRILVGTMTGTAEMVAQEVQQTLETAGHHASIEMMDNLDSSVFSGGGVFLICSSTYGNGDVPDNAQALYASLETTKPDLSGITYGVIALGDRTYKDTFCHGGLRFDRILTELGARRAGDILKHDASSGTLPEEVAAQWVVPWIEHHLETSSEISQ